MVNEQTVKPDIIIPNTSSTNIRYVLWRDQQRGLAWWRVGGRNIQEGDGKDVLSAVWDRGWAGGMGETQRIAPNSLGYAFAQGWDCSQDGFARLSPQQITVSNGNITDDWAAFWFELTHPGGAGYQYVYLHQGTNLAKYETTTGGSSITLVYSYVIGGTAGPGCLFEGKRYLPLGASNEFVEITTVNPTLLKQFYYNGSTYTDNTTEAKSQGGTPFTLLSGASDYAYFGCFVGKFDALYFDIQTASVGATVSWEYWNGAWTALSVTDGTTNFTTDGIVKWTKPGDWAQTTVNTVNAYWVRAVPSGAFGTAPTCNYSPVIDKFTTADSGQYALAFTATQSGATAKIAKGYSTNLVALAATAPTTAGSWGSGFEVGDSSHAITNMVDTGLAFYVSKADGLFRFDNVGVAWKLPIPNVPDNDNGTGLIGVAGTETAIYNDISGLYLVDGDSVRNISSDTIPTNVVIPNVTYQPIRGRHYEATMFGRWLYIIYTVTESGTTTSYLLAGHLDDNGAIRWHTLASPGSLRGAFIDSAMHLWSAEETADVASYWQLGKDGSPEAGRNNLGYGVNSSEYVLYLPEVHLETPLTNKQLMVMEVKLRGAHSTCPVQLQICRDGGAVANVGATVTSDGVTRRYWTLGTNDTGVNFRPVIDVDTGASYAPASRDLQVWGLALRTVPRPIRGDKVQIIIDCLKPYSNGSPQIDSPLTIRSTLQALENAAPVSCKDPNGNTVVLQILSVNDAGVFWNPDGTISYLLEIEAAEFVNV